jgi:hypothetical protein
MSHLISGNAGVAGATVSWSGTASGSITADNTGNYTISSLADGNYTITPSLSSFTFTPTSSSQTMAGADILGVNFTASDGNTAFSEPDDRNFNSFPNSAIDVQGTETYVVPAKPSHAPSVDSRAAGAPVDSRVSADIPENSRTTP